MLCHHFGHIYTHAVVMNGGLCGSITALNHPALTYAWRLKSPHRAVLRIHSCAALEVAGFLNCK